MDRRELLKMVALLTGGAVIGSEFFLSGCTAGGKAELGFTPGNIALLDEVGETILPATSSPGAKAAQVGEFMKVYVTDCYPQASQDAFIKGINDLDADCKKLHSKSFMDCTPEQRHEFLLSLEKQSKEFNTGPQEEDKKNRAELKAKNKEYDFVAKPRHYYTMMKQLTLLGFFTSKVGATQALRHIPVPGKYDGAYSYKKGDKAWAE
ncbi:MAG TPA: gluconate 2-dehydrogenase subunit 3 family protein [Chitinophagaceae bacterium]